MTSVTDPANLLSNAGFVDGFSNWHSTSAFTIDEDNFGAPGRAVLYVNDVAGGAGTIYVDSDPVSVTGGDVVLAFGHVAAIGQPTAQVMVLQKDGAGNAIGTLAIPLERPADSSVHPSRGVPSMFDFYYGSVTTDLAAHSVTFRLQINVLGAGTFKGLLYKPFLMLNPDDNADCIRWDPGSHLNIDLQLPVWPSILPSFMADSLQINSTPMRKGYTNDLNIPLTRRMAMGADQTLTGSLMLNILQRDALDQLFYGGSEQFWIVNPRTDQLCFGSWMPDGDPKDAGVGPISHTEIGILLEVA